MAVNERQDRLEHIARQQAAIADLGLRALADVDLPALMDHAANLVAQTLQVEFVKVLELLPDGRQLLLRAGVGWEEGLVGQALVECGAGSQAGYTLTSRAPVISEDLRTETRFRASPLSCDHGLVSGISVVIYAHGRGVPFGILGALTPYFRRFTEDEANFLQAVANVLAAAIERKRVEQALREREEQLHQALESGHMGAWDWNALTNDVTWSPSLEAIHGLAPGSFGRTFDAFMSDVHPEDRRRVAQALAHVLEHGTSLDIEYRIVRPDGSIRWVQGRGQIFRDVDGKPTRMRGLCMDVTERKRAEEAQRFFAEASNTLATSLDYAATLQVVARLAIPYFGDWCQIYMLAEAGKIERLETAHADPSHAELLNELRGRYPIDLDTDAPVCQVLRTGKPVLLSEITDSMLEKVARDAEHLRILRELKPRSALIVPLIARGRILGAITLASTVAGRYSSADLALSEGLAHRAALAVDNARLYQETQEALRREQQHSARLHGLAKASLAINAAISLEATLQVITEQARDRIGAHQAVSSMTLDQNWAQAINAVSLSDKYAAWRSYAAQPDGSGIYSLVCKTNRPMRLTQAELEAHPAWRGFGKEAGKHPPLRGWLAAPFIGRDGRNIGLIQLSDKYVGDFDADDEAVLVQLAHLASVVIEKAQLYQEIQKLNAGLEQRARELAAANRELEAFSYSVSHDLRAPLRAIDGFSRILLDEHASELTPEAQRYLELVRNGAQQMGDLIDDLLTFSRLSRHPVRKQTIAPAQLLQQVLEDLYAEMEGRRVEISVGDLPSCQADPSLVKLVFGNLLSNALKFTRRREVTLIEIGCRDEKGELVYYVKDNGVGFDMRYAHKLFGVFQRLHRAEEFEGTGVGLAIVQRIVHRHGGRVWAEAEVDRGATFFFTI